MKKLSIFLMLVLMVSLLGCATKGINKPDHSFLCNKTHAIPSKLIKSRYGNPACYDVAGKKYYVLDSAEGYCQTGLASWYGTKFHGKNTSSREPYNMFALTAASRTLPLPTYVEVTNLENGKKIVVKVNDRGPFKSDRIIDLSYAAALKLGFADRGTAKVQVKAVTQDQVQQEDVTPQIILLAEKEDSTTHSDHIELPAPSAMSKSVTLSRYLQLGAFANYDNAARLQKKIEMHSSISSRIKEVNQGNKTIYRVQIGPLQPSEASQIQSKLKSLGFDNIINIFS